MVTRALMLAAGLTGAAASSQFPEYSQQYMQRLGGAVDELARQIQRHERDAETVGLDLPGLLAGLEAEGPLAGKQASNIRADIDRHARLSADLEALEGAGPFTRLKLVSHLRDSAIARRALAAYRPAMPASFEGAVFAGTGFVAGWGGLAALLAFVSGGLSFLRGGRRRRA